VKTVVLSRKRCKIEIVTTARPLIVPFPMTFYAGFPLMGVPAALMPSGTPKFGILAKASTLRWKWIAWRYWTSKNYLGVMRTLYSSMAD